MTDLNSFIKKSHLRAVEKFNAELQAWAKETGEEQPTLYESVYTTFTLSDVRVEDGKLCYLYDGKPDSDNVVLQDEETGKYYEDELYGIMESIKFWRYCLRRAKRYWATDPEVLDAMADGKVEDEEEEDND